MPTPPLPVVKAFLVCDQVIHDAQTGKKSLIGLFHEIKAARFPTVRQELWIYANLTDAHGPYTFQIRIVDVGTGQVLGSGEPPSITIKDPRMTTELSAQLRGVGLPRTGLFEFQLLANGELAATKAIRVSGLAPGHGPSPETGGEFPADEPEA